MVLGGVRQRKGSELGRRCQLCKRKDDCRESQVDEVGCGFPEMRIAQALPTETLSIGSEPILHSSNCPPAYDASDECAERRSKDQIYHMGIIGPQERIATRRWTE